MREDCTELILTVSVSLNLGFSTTKYFFLCKINKKALKDYLQDRRLNLTLESLYLKGVFGKNERGYRLNAKNKRF